MIRALLLSLLLALPAHAAELPPAATDYLAELARVESAPVPQSLETLLRKAEAVQSALMTIEGGAGSDSVLERYEDREFAELQRQLRGLHLQRGLEVFVQPLPDFFLDLATRKGRPADQAFFRLYRDYWGTQLFPVYMEPRATIMGCVKYGDGLLNRLHRDWAGFHTRFPTDYAAEATQMVRDFEEIFELGTCACGDRDSVIRELREFTRSQPHNPATPAATRRWQELDSRQERLPHNCG